MRNSCTVVFTQSAGSVPREMAEEPARATGLALCVVLTIILGVMCVGCGAASAPGSGAQPLTPTASLPEPSPTAVPSATSVPTAIPTLATSPVPLPSPTAQSGLVTQDIQFSGAASVEDLNTLLLRIRELPGVQDAQGGVNDLLITYDPKQVTRAKIVETIQGLGYRVKE